MQILHILPLNIMKKSHGESFLALAQNNTNPNGLYLFDEPEAALETTLLMQIYRYCKRELIYYSYAFANFVAGTRCRYLLF